MRRCLGLLLVLAALFRPALVRGGGTIAVMPVEDLSQGANGYSQTMTANIITTLRDRGASVVPEAEVMEFMVKNRIRWLGYLDSQQIGKAKEKLGADLVILASVNQRRETDPPVFGLTMQVVRTVDGRVVWAGGGELCRADVRRLLGLAEPKTIEDVERLVVRQVMANLPESFVPHAGGGPSGQVDSVRLSATVLLPGETVACRIKFSGQKGPKCEDVVVLVGGKEVPVTFREREHYYEAVWLAEAVAGEVGVSLRVGGKEAGGQEIFVGTYQVDSQPPKVVLQAVGPRLDGHVIIREGVSLVPVLAEPEPIRRWHLEVVDREGRIVMVGDGEGLPDRFVWQGQTSHGGMAADGLYKVILGVWDRAGNHVTSDLDVELLRRPPPVEIVLSRSSEGVAIDLGYGDRVPLAHWRAELVSATGDLIQEDGGERLPARLLVAREVVEGAAKIRLTFAAQDILGNQVKRIINDIGRAAKAETAATNGEQQAPAAGWVEDF